MYSSERETNVKTEPRLPVVIDSAPPSKLSARHEAFVGHLMAGESMTSAYRLVYGHHAPDVLWAAATRLRARQDVQERLAELTAIAARKAVISREVLLRELHELATTDASAVSRVVVDPCPVCWPDDVLGAATDRWIAGESEPPDTERPRAGCRACRGRGITQVVHTPTADLSEAARRLYAGAKTKSDGSVEVSIVDQLAARNMLHELLGLKVHRSETKNLNLNANVPTPQNVSPEDVLALWKATR